VDAQVPQHATQVVTELYQAHALGLVRLAVIMLGDQATAEDVVQDAFLGLYRHWDRLADTSSALAYVRSSVLNGCRTVLRRQSRDGGRGGLGGGLAAAAATFAGPPLESAEVHALLSEQHREVLAAPNQVAW